MSSVTLGTAPLKISSEVSFDPRYGYQTRETYSGTAATINTLNATLTLLGIRTNTSFRGGRNYLEAYYAIDNTPGAAPETPTDFWELETEYVQESVWKNRKVEIAAQQAAAAGQTVLKVLAGWRQVIEAAMKGKQLTDFNDDGTGIFEKQTEGPLDPALLASPLNNNENALALYQLILRDGTAYETTRQVLTRSRQISINYATKAVAQSEPIVYSTQELVNEFQIPAAVAQRLPANPSYQPSDTFWGWKQRKNTSRYEWNGRVAEVMSWTFAAWSTVTHKLKTGTVLDTL